LTAGVKTILRLEGVFYSYQKDLGKQGETREPPYAIRGVDLSIDSGEYVAVIGANGSGKSTLLRLLNALLVPSSGNVWVEGWNSRDGSQLRNIRSTVGMVFQVPDTQIVASTVEEDVAFGPENLGIPKDELENRIEWALSVTGIFDLRKKPSHLLSEGQKQLLAIASALSMKPACLLLDEPTSMLDPSARSRVLKTLRYLHETGVTIVTATHCMEEASLAQRIVVLHEGRVVMTDSPESLFQKDMEISKYRLELPAPARLAKQIGACVKGFPSDILNVQDLVGAVVSFAGGRRNG
jgi:energy-coupling factor transporter ATPase